MEKQSRSMTLKEFKASVKCSTSPKKKKISNSWGVYDYYKYYRVHRPNTHEYVLYESVYFAIIRRVNKLLVEKLCNTGSVEFPHRMGKLTVFRRQPKTYIYNNKVVTTKMIDWDKTLELWYNDEEAHKKKTLLYKDRDRVITKYDKRNAIYKNKYYYDFTLCRDARAKLVDSYNSQKLKLNEVFSNAQFEQIKGLYDEY